MRFEHLNARERDTYEERAAIFEYLGNLPRATAEEYALHCMTWHHGEPPQSWHIPSDVWQEWLREQGMTAYPRGLL